MKKTLLLLLGLAWGAWAQPVPIRGLHLAAPNPDEMPLAERFIREALPKEGVNVLVLEFNYRYQYKRHPEVADANALSLEDVKRLVAASRAAGVRLIPQINMLGHQSWAKTTFGLLRAHPEFDETPGLYPGNQGIYCRSYCPLHPKVHDVVFDLMEELSEACESDALHAGMDEIFLLGEDECPRCRGKSKAELFSGEVTALRNRLAASHRELWIWGDRLLDGEATGIGKWEAATNFTAPAIHEIPKDVLICDWHYEAAHPTGPYFALEGFRVVSSPWRKAAVALRQLDLVRSTRMNASGQVAARMQGMLHTTWCGFAPFARAYFGEDFNNAAAVESVVCFRELFREMRKLP
jgi:hypothetical protein